MTTQAQRDQAQENTCLDRIALKFERDWQVSKSRPRIEDYLQQARELAPELVLRDCLLVELQMRRGGGEVPDLNEYFGRFPDHRAVIEQAFSETLSSHRDASLPDRGEFAGITFVEGRPSVNRIGQYSVVRTLGQGGFGIVYLAQHTLLRNRQVAIKVPRPDRTLSREQISMLLAEARTVSDLQHPGVVQVVDVYELSPRGEIRTVPADDSVYAVVMEYVDGQSLADIVAALPQERPELRRVIQIVAQAAETAAFVHAHDYFHRDLKPANILIAASGEVKIADFGLALHESEFGNFAGTPSYMSPEQISSKQEVNGGTDIWSLGVILYQLLTGRLPYRTTRDNADLFDKILNQDPRPPSEIDPSIPDEIARICLKCLHKDRLKRFLSASELSRNLWRAIGERSGPQHLIPKSSRPGAEESHRASSAPSLAPVTGTTGDSDDVGASLNEANSTPAFRQITTPIGLEMIQLPPGEFLMGASAEETAVAGADEFPQHRVVVKAFQVGIYPITCDQFQRVMGVALAGEDDMAPGESFPVTRVSWNEAVRFCNRLSEFEGLAPYYAVASMFLPLRRRESIIIAQPETDGYRLLTEAEWEYACRADGCGMWTFGDEEAWLAEYARFGQATAAPVGQYSANAWGLHDMHGNAWEWCWDAYSSAYYHQSEVIDPRGPNESDQRVLRGGAFYSKPQDVRSARRNKDVADRKQHDVGFRIARSV